MADLDATSPADLMQALLDIAEEERWPFRMQYCGRSCNCREGRRCVSCHAEEGKDHEPECEARAFLLRAQAFINVEREQEAALEEAEYARALLPQDAAPQAPLAPSVQLAAQQGAA